MTEEILYIQFNQDFSSLGVGTGHGWSLVSNAAVESLDKIHEAAAPDGVQIVERLFSSSLVAIVSLQSPRKLRVCHFKKGNEICNYSYANSILGVRLNRARLVVCLEEMLYIHNIRDMKILHTIRDTPPNPKGLLALSVNADISYLAYPGSGSTGQVQVFDAFNLQAKTVIHAHASPLAALVFNAAGTLLATASEKGTVIRVFSTSDASRIFEFRRGMKRYASIYSIAFSPDDVFLAVSSNTATVHVFRLQNAPEVKEETTSNSWMDWMKGALPAQVTEVWTQGRSFASITTAFQETRSVVAVAPVSGTDGTKMRVLVASYDGYLYIYGLNTTEGGECTLIKQHRLCAETGFKKTATPSGTTASYAGVVKGRSPKSMSGLPRLPVVDFRFNPQIKVPGDTKSDKMAEMRNAIGTPTKTDDADFPTFP